MYLNMDKIIFESRREIEIIQSALDNTNKNLKTETEQKVINEFTDLLEVMYLNW